MYSSLMKYTNLTRGENIANAQCCLQVVLAWAVVVRDVVNLLPPLGAEVKRKRSAAGIPLQAAAYQS
jgi:hypothetical protein